MRRRLPQLQSGALQATAERNFPPPIAAMCRAGPSWRIQGERTLTEFAAELDLSKQYLSNVYNRRREPSDRLQEKLGFTRQTTYVQSPSAAPKEKKK